MLVGRHKWLEGHVSCLIDPSIKGFCPNDHQNRVKPQSITRLASTPWKAGSDNKQDFFHFCMAERLHHFISEKDLGNMIPRFVKPGLEYCELLLCGAISQGPSETPLLCPIWSKFTYLGILIMETALHQRSTPCTSFSLAPKCIVRSWSFNCENPNALQPEYFSTWIPI